MSALVAEPELSRLHWTATQYFELGKTGFISPEDRTELIRGEIYMMPPIGSWHASAVSRATHKLVLNVGEKAIISSQNPIEMAGDSVPEPDFTILRPKDDFYSEKLPTPEDVILTIEISDSSYLYDKNVKAPLYAENGIPELWVVHRKRAEVTVFSEIKDGVYTSEIVFSGDEMLIIPEIGVQVSLSDFGL